MKKLRRCHPLYIVPQRDRSPSATRSQPGKFKRIPQNEILCTPLTIVRLFVTLNLNMRKYSWIWRKLWSLYIKRGKVSVRRPTSVTVGVASSVANDVTMRMTHNENGGCERRGRHNENDFTMTIAGLLRYGHWRHVATGCTAQVFVNIRCASSDLRRLYCVVPTLVQDRSSCRRYRKPIDLY